MLREQVRDKSYRAYPMGQRAGEYLRWKRGRITPSTYRSYESRLDKLAREFPDLHLEDFEPPVGVGRLEEFCDRAWGDAAPATYNTSLAVYRDFFKWAVLKGYLHGDPTLPMLRHKKRQVHREIFSDDSSAAIIAGGPHPDYLRRDRIALRLLLEYGIRKGSLQKIQFKHFDMNRRRLTIFAKGGKVRELPIPQPSFWDDLEKLIFEIAAEPQHFLIARKRHVNSFRGYDRKTGKALTEVIVRKFPDQEVGSHALHDWWYGCLQRAGVVLPGASSGEKMHKARHTAGQRVLDKTGNLKATQKLLGHASITTTADVYTDWDIDQLERTMSEVLGGE